MERRRARQRDRTSEVAREDEPVSFDPSALGVGVGRVLGLGGRVLGLGGRVLGLGGGRDESEEEKEQDASHGGGS